MYLHTRHTYINIKNLKVNSEGKAIGQFYHHLKKKRKKYNKRFNNKITIKNSVFFSPNLTIVKMYKSINTFFTERYFYTYLYIIICYTEHQGIAMLSI